MIAAVTNYRRMSLTEKLAYQRGRRNLWRCKRCGVKVLSRDREGHRGRCAPELGRGELFERVDKGPRV